MINFLASGKTKEAQKILRDISQKEFDQFFKKDLKTLCKKSNANDIITFVENYDSCIYKYAEKLNENENMSGFKSAIDKQAKSKSTKSVH